VAEIHAAIGQRRQRQQRLVDRDAARHVQQVPAGPEGRMQRGELVVGRIDGAAHQVPLDQIAVLGHHLIQAAEQDALR
jgi:hypothetical protein